MNRKELINIIKNEQEEILKLFESKNESYGDEGEAFYNFRQSATRIFNDDSLESQFKILLTLMDKHSVALANKGIADIAFEERLKDIIVYSHIAIAMKEELKWLNHILKVE